MKPCIMKTRLTYNFAHLGSTKESLTFEYLDKENILFAEERKNGEGKGWKYMEKEIYFFAEEKRIWEDFFWRKRLEKTNICLQIFTQ